jgi:hypothetical protein
MSIYKTTKGSTVDLSVVLEKNKDVVAAGNVRMNANGDELDNGGAIARPARKVSQAAHNVTKEVRSVGIKGRMDEEVPEISKTKKEVKPSVNTATPQSKPKKGKEVELDDGSIEIVEDGE